MVMPRVTSLVRLPSGVRKRWEDAHWLDNKAENFGVLNGQIVRVDYA